MKKNLLRIFVAALCLAAVNVAMAAKLYVLGSDGSWNPSAPSAELDETASGVYEGDVTFTNLYFGLGSALGADSGDWGTFNAHRYGPTSPDFLLTPGKAAAMEYGVDRSFKLPSTGTYHVAVDINAATLTLTSAASYPSQVYIKGGTAVTPIEIPSVGTGKYSAEVELDGVTAIFIGETMGYDGAYYGASANGAGVRVNYPMQLVPNGQGFQADLHGTYTVTVDLAASTLLVEKEGYEPDEPYTLYLHNGQYSIPLPVNAVADGVYTSWVRLTDGEFTVTSRLTDDDADVAYKSVSPADAADAFLMPHRSVAAALSTEEAVPFKADASEAAPWEGYVSVNLKSGRVLLYCDADEEYPADGTPNELYLVGDMNFWDYGTPSCVLLPTENGGIYKGQVTLRLGDYFTVLQRLGPSWDYVNPKRLAPEEDGEEMLDGQAVFMLPGYSTAWCFADLSGTYDVTANLMDMTLRFSKPVVNGITSVTDAAEAASQPVYDLTGRRVGAYSMKPGIYVQNGRKRVVK